MLPEKILAKINPATLTKEALERVTECLKKKGKSQQVFEFGSGVSTLLYSHLIAEGVDLKVHSVESSRQYYPDTVNSLIGCNRIRVYRTPMKVKSFFGKKLWAYDPSLIAKVGRSVGKFDLVLIDGPKSWLFGREATLYQISPFVSPDTVIFLDDACRKDREVNVLEAWKKVWGENICIDVDASIGNGLARIQLLNPRKMKWFPFTSKEKSEAADFAESVLRTEWKNKFAKDNF